MSALMLSDQQKKWLSGYGIDEPTWLTLCNSIYPGSQAESVMLAVQYCKARGLDVLKKPVHIVPMKVKDAKTGSSAWRDVIMPGIYEARMTASRTGEYAGQDAPAFGEMIEMSFGGQTARVPESCTVTVYRIIGNQRVAFSHTEWFEEAAGTKSDGSLNAMWTKRKRGQLSKCAEAGALRKAFPDELGGILTLDEINNEAHQDQPRDITPQPEEAPVIEYYPSKQFDENFPAWEKAIKDGVLAKNDAINRASTKGQLTEKQIEKINSIEVTANANA